MFRRPLAALSVVLAVSALASSPSAAQQGGPLEPPSTGGLTALLQELQFLGHNKRVLVIAAHPDDEDTELLVMLTRREGAEAAYLSLTRGEGGQNLIGTELGDALGILRTEELLSARRIDGAQQFFTRAYDFGFSKTLDDTWAHWPKDSVLKDVVRIVRRFRPQIIVSVFSGTPRDGHGQHQAAGWAAQEAFRVAGDPARFPELQSEEGLSPWSPTKIYTSARFGINGATLTLDGGQVEKLSGKTYHQLAMASRSLHRSQDMGQLQDFGPSPSPLHFLASKSGAADSGEGWGAFWSGVDTTLQAPAPHLQAVSEARAAAGKDRLAVATALDRAQVALRSVDVPSDYREHIQRAVAVVSWLFVDGVADRSRVAAGDSLGVAINLRNAGTIPTGEIADWIVRSTGRVYGSIVADLPPGASNTNQARMFVDPTWSATTPYYMHPVRRGDLYDWTGVTPRSRGTPGGDPEFTLSVLVESGGGSSLGAVSSRFRDQSFGEIRTPVTIVPRVSVKLTPNVAVVRTTAIGDARSITADVELESGTVSSISGTVTIEVPNGWSRPTPVPFSLAHIDAIQHLTISVPVPASARPGQYEIRAVATDGAGQRYDIGAFLVEYPHIRPRQYTKAAVARVEVMELTPPAVSHVGYVRGAADKIPEALAAAGMHVTMLDSAALTTGDLRQFDVIVIGPRAYEVDSAVVRNNQRLNDYARDGGRVVVQYQQQFYLEGHFAPYALGGNSRITDEHSPVTMLSATTTQSAVAPVFRGPNPIGPDDWDGWIQDRALYCPTNWGPEFHPLLAMNDPGEAPIRGCLLESSVGRGSYVYSGIAFFRELPAGVPGAYRLFFNLLGGRVTP